MKRLTATILAITLTFSLAACGIIGGSVDEGSHQPERNNGESDLTTDNSTSEIPQGDIGNVTNGETISQEPQGGEFLYAQIDAAILWSGDGYTFTNTGAQWVSGIKLLFEGYTREDFRDPQIENFKFFINGEERSDSRLSDVTETEVVQLPHYKFPHVTEEEGYDTGTVYFYYVHQIVGEAGNFWETYPAEYWFEATINGVFVRSDTFVWTDEATCEYRDDMPVPSTPLKLVPKMAVQPLAPIDVDSNERGNIPGNTYVAAKGDFVYYVMDDELYRMNADGMNVTKFDLDLRVSGVNAVGDWIYFIGRQGALYGQEQNGIYRVRSDGTGLTFVVDSSGVGSFFIDGEWIYYTANTTELNLYRARTSDGSEQTTVYEKDFVEFWVYNVSGDWFYYMMLEYDYTTIHRGNTSDRIRETLEIADAENITDIKVADGWIYFRDRRSLKKINIDTLEQVLLVEDNDEVNGFIVAGDWVYYNILDYDEQGWTREGGDILRRVRTDGTGDMRIGDFKVGVGSVNIGGDWIFYRDGSDRNYYRVRTDGTGSELVWSP